MISVEKDRRTTRVRRRTLTHEERLTLIYAQVPETRIVFAQKRWGGVFVNDYFGEGYMARLGLQRGNDDTEASGPGRGGRITQYDAGLYALDYALLKEGS